MKYLKRINEAFTEDQIDDIKEYLLSFEDYGVKTELFTSYFFNIQECEFYIVYEININGTYTNDIFSLKREQINLIYYLEASGVEIMDYNDEITKVENGYEMSSDIYLSELYDLKKIDDIYIIAQSIPGHMGVTTFDGNKYMYISPHSEEHNANLFNYLQNNLNDNFEVKHRPDMIIIYEK